MPKTAWCSVCVDFVWLSDDGRCPKGHPHSSLRSIREAQLPAGSGAAGADVAIATAKNLSAAGLRDKAQAPIEILEANPYQSPPPFEKLVGELWRR